MQIGGNNAFFADVADACFYHSAPGQDYSHEFKDDQDLDNCKSACCAAISRSQNYISNSMSDKFKETVNKLLSLPNAKADSKFKLYVLGYAHFFDLNPDGDWCERESFYCVPQNPFTQAFLSIELRTKINDLTQQVNDIYRTTISQTWPTNKVGFVDISPAFEGHRFCEGGTLGNHKAQYSDGNVWFWNLALPASGDDGCCTPPTVPEPFLLETMPPGTQSGSGPGNIREGWERRPFHPRQAGYRAIKDTVKAALKADNVGAG